MATNYILIPRVGEPIDRTLQRFKKGVLMAGVFREMKERASYTKPSQRRRLKSKRARLKLRKAEVRSEQQSEWYSQHLERVKARG